ncbi:Acyl-[acyl-carrier-protein]--UDP-N-acetylglucosamine O-acyltransferase OS=Afipia felis OX=1035 GN=lpxA_2 PE=3 SV=1 [Afipia felis]
MARIDPSARVESGAVVGADVTIGPFCVVGPHAVIGAGTTLVSHVNVSGVTEIGESCTVYPFASLGTAPQSTSYRGEPTKLVIGNSCIIREGVTMNTGTVSGGGVTSVGDRGFFMNNSHVGHDCHVGNDVIFATSATLGGHCTIGDFVFIGGLSAVHQFTWIGSQVMVGGMSGVTCDIIPYAIANGQRARLEGLNAIGMKRRGFNHSRLKLVRSFYQNLFHGAGVFAERLAALQGERDSDPAIAEILDFIAADRHRPLSMPPPQADQS